MRTSSPIEEIRLRACAIILRERRILLSRALKNLFWELPGGRIEVGEMSTRALVRELEEELGVPAVPVGRLAFVVENRFAHGGRRFHEIGLVYEVDLAEAQWPTIEGEFESVEPELRFRWFELAELTAIDLRPRPLRDRLCDSIPVGTVHLEVDGLKDA